MSPERIDPRHGPSPEQLAAFLEGDLHPDLHDQVDNWLADHPEAQAGLNADRDLDLLFRETVPPEPSPEAWEATLAHIQSRVFDPPVRPRSPRWGVRLVAGLVSAAAVLAGVLLVPPTFHHPDGSAGLVTPEGEGFEEEPFVVASAREVNIISMDARDADAVVMGMPLMGLFQLAEQDDIEVLDAEPPHADGPVPWLEEGPVPLIVASAGGS
jgi:hypothetical protein